MATNETVIISPHICDNTEPEVFCYADPSKNLLKNWSFDHPISDNDWIITQADATRCPDAHTGKYSLHVHSRSHKHGQAYQRLYNLQPDTTYYYSFFIKFLSHPKEQMYFGARVFINIKFKDIVRKQRVKVAWLKFQKAPSMWQQMGSDFKTPDEPFEYIETHMEIDPTDVDFLLDTASLTELPPDPNWRETTDKLIDKHRKSNVTLKISLPKRTKPGDFEIKVKQTKRDFGFGAAITADIFNDETSHKYRECFFKHFEWAVFCNDTKWKPMERKRGEIRLERVDKAIEKLHERGVTVRGHAIHWNNKKNCPDWIHDKEGAELQDEIDRRTDYVVKHFKGRLVQWDVCNETLHNHYFEETTGKYDQLEHLFRRANEIDPDCKLYLNDFKVFRNGELTSGQRNLAKHLLSSGTPLHGIGIQSHLRSLPLPYHILKKRLDVVASVGLPVMITELSLHTLDVEERKEALEIALRLYFSHPSILGVLFWHFSDQKGATMEKGHDMALFEGPDFEPNAAGLMLQELLRQWRTNETFAPSKRRSVETFRAYHGQYEVEVCKDGEVVWEQSFSVEKCKDLEMEIKIDAEDTENDSDSNGGEEC